MRSRYRDLQRRLRQNMPTPEIILWQRVRNKQLGIKFRRQYAVNNRILDFYAPTIRLGIEIDGESHFMVADQRERERDDDTLLFKRYRITIVRLLNSEVMNNIDGALYLICEHIARLQGSSNHQSNPPPNLPL